MVQLSNRTPQLLRVVCHMKLDKKLPWTDLHPHERLKLKIGPIAVSDTAAYCYCCHTALPGQPNGVQAITLQKATDDSLRYRTPWRDPSSGTGLGNLILLISHEVPLEDYFQTEVREPSLAVPQTGNAQRGLFTPKKVCRDI